MIQSFYCKTLSQQTLKKFRCTTKNPSMTYLILWNLMMNKVMQFEFWDYSLFMIGRLSICEAQN